MTYVWDFVSVIVLLIAAGFVGATYYPAEAEQIVEQVEQRRLGIIVWATTESCSRVSTVRTAERVEISNFELCAGEPVVRLRVPKRQNRLDPVPMPSPDPIEESALNSICGVSCGERKLSPKQ